MSFDRSLVILPFLAVLSACGGSTNQIPLAPVEARISGTVTSAQGPIAKAAIALYLAGSQSPRNGATALARATSGADGTFTLRYAPPATRGVLYAVALGGSAGSGSANTAIGLLSVAGVRGSYARNLTINEFTTVAGEFALAQFADDAGTDVGATSSNHAGIENAASLALTNLADPGSGGPAPFWPAKSACKNASSLADNCEGLERLNSLANALAACTTSANASSSACKALFTLTHSHGTTLAAIHSIVIQPAQHANEIFALSRRSHTYSPVLAAAPSAWFVALKYVGNGKEFDGPGAMAIDAAGNVWANNNYEFKSDHRLPTCGGRQLLELTPTGSDARGAPFSGGGVNGVGWGITLDPHGNVWLGNFGFAGKGCTEKPPANSASEFSASGTALSPKAGYTRGPIDAAQATTVDQAGNIWFANFGDTSITEYPGGDPAKAKYFPKVGVSRPFSISVAADGNIWITSFGNDAVVAIAPNGRPLPGSPFTGGGIKRPLGNAFDSLGNLWVSNSTGDSVTALDSSGSPVFSSPLKGGGIRLPWGIAVDGNDNVWVADFSGFRPRVSELCGARPANCPAGSRTGSPLSPKEGFASKLLMRLTGISIDASGNVWVCNNWLPVPIQTNPGGDALVEFVGLAGPVKTPLVGPPAQP
jgi:sugar lactone lactonase YvrE